jgi:hypothetical protein
VISGAALLTPLVINDSLMVKVIYISSVLTAGYAFGSGANYKKRRYQYFFDSFGLPSNVTIKI